jgi:uncharacterized membrane protein YqiK
LICIVVVVAVVVVVVVCLCWVFRQRQREADRSWILGRAGGRGKKIANVNHEEGRMMIAAGGRQHGRMDGDAAGGTE